MVGLQTNDGSIMYYKEEGDVRVTEVNEKTSQFKTEGQGCCDSVAQEASRIHLLLEIWGHRHMLPGKLGSPLGN